ncbi:MAG TPA: hypothetical protein VKA68_11730 [bacterium]|nr:hypothetical protein [bacterium]
MAAPAHIHFPEKFRQELYDKLRIPGTDILDTVRVPDSSQQLSVDDLQLHFYWKFFPQQPRPYYILAYGQMEGATLHLHMGWKIAPDIHTAVDELTPLDLLRVFAEKYGLDISLGDHRTKFICNETIVVDDPVTHGIQIHNPEGHAYVQQIFTKTIPRDEGVQVVCALGLCINIDYYRTDMFVE